LEWLINTHSNNDSAHRSSTTTDENKDSSTIIDIDKSLSGGSSLVLMRLTSWFRLTYAFGSRVGLRIQLLALRTFMNASVDAGHTGIGAGTIHATGTGGHGTHTNYLSEFVSAGGIPTLLQCLVVPHNTIRDEERHAALSVLTVLARASRALKELMCQQNVVVLTVRVLSTTTTTTTTGTHPRPNASTAGTSTATLESAKRLLILLGTVSNMPLILNSFIRLFTRSLLDCAVWLGQSTIRISCARRAIVSVSFTTAQYVE
jgi:hypothetical protein